MSSAAPEAPRPARVLMVGAGTCRTGLLAVLGGGVELAWVLDGSTALAALRGAPAPPDAVIVDLTAPGADDPDFAVQLRAALGSRRTLVVAVLSACPTPVPAWVTDPSAVDVLMPRPVDVDS